MILWKSKNEKAINEAVELSIAEDFGFFKIKNHDKIIKGFAIHDIPAPPRRTPNHPVVSNEKEFHPSEADRSVLNAGKNKEATNSDTEIDTPISFCLRVIKIKIGRYL